MIARIYAINRGCERLPQLLINAPQRLVGESARGITPRAVAAENNRERVVACDDYRYALLKLKTRVGDVRGHEDTEGCQQRQDVAKSSQR